MFALYTTAIGILHNAICLFMLLSLVYVLNQLLPAFTRDV